jgi:hypothetical protein
VAKIFGKSSKTKRFLSGLQPDAVELLLLIERELAGELAQGQARVECQQDQGGLLGRRPSPRHVLGRLRVWVERSLAHFRQEPAQQAPTAALCDRKAMRHDTGPIQRFSVLVRHPVAHQSGPVAGIDQSLDIGGMDICRVGWLMACLLRCPRWQG